MKVKVLLVAEVDVGESTDIPTDVQTLLDNFREAVAPSREYGIALYQATADDLAAFSASSRLGQPLPFLEAPDAGSLPEARFMHRFPTLCPACGSDLTKPEAVKLVYTIGDGEISETFSRLDASGLLVDVGGVVAHGYHSDTICRNCLSSLADDELAD